MKYLPYVNIKMGTRSVMRYSNGNTLPLTQMPFGMVALCPQTNGESRWFYSPDFPYTEGVRITHQPSPWIGDYGTFLMIPQTDIICNTPSMASSSVLERDSEMSPHYLRLSLLRPSCVFELSPTERACAMRLTFKGNMAPYLSFLASQGSYEYKLEESGILFGTSDAHSQDDAQSFKMYFAVRFKKEDVDFANCKIGENYAHIALNSKNAQASLAISYISHEMALLALEREIGARDFDEIRASAESVWEEHLSRIEIDSDSEEMLRTFYSCMYRAFLFPHKAYELDENGRALHYTPIDGKIRDGVRYTDNGFWDTYRTVYPLYSLIARDEFADMMRSFVGDYNECGWLPRWISIGEVGCMPSTLIDAVIAEASTQKIADKALLENALDGMLHHASTPSKEKRYGREGIAEYVKYGYVPSNKYKESVNLTLDFAYGDWCIATVAKALGRDEIYKEYIERARNYRHLFDKNEQFMRAKDENGTFSPDFDPFKWGGDYTEASAWQSTLSVQHDIEGLCDLYGGKAELIAYLDRLFDASPDFRVHGYGTEIHEMSEMAVVDLGQCAISNQPSFHIPFMYAYLGEKEKSEYWIRRICTELFAPTPDGYPGDEDNGTMSAWYILACLGLYRMCPGKDEWTKITPLVKNAKIMGKSLDEIK